MKFLRDILDNVKPHFEKGGITSDGWLNLLLMIGVNLTNINYWKESKLQEEVFPRLKPELSYTLIANPKRTI